MALKMTSKIDQTLLNTNDQYLLDNFDKNSDSVSDIEA